MYKNTVTPESVLSKKHHSITYHRCCKAVSAGNIRVAKQGTEKNIADLFKKRYCHKKDGYYFWRDSLIESMIGINVLDLVFSEGFNHTMKLKHLQEEVNYTVRGIYQSTSANNRDTIYRYLG